MPKAESLHKHTLNLYEGDYARLQSYYPEVGAGVVIRKIIRKHLEVLDSKSGSDVKVDPEVQALFQE